MIDQLLIVLALATAVVTLLAVLVWLIGPEYVPLYRRLRGGHWEEWGPGFTRPSWWLRSPSGRCSNIHRVYGRSRYRCEDYPDRSADPAAPSGG